MLKAAITLSLVLGLAVPALTKAASGDLGSSRPGVTKVAKKKKKDKKEEEKKEGGEGGAPPPENPAPQR